MSKFHSFYSKTEICEICELGVNIESDWVLRRFRKGHCESYCEKMVVG